jgi:hypothetical protein
MDVSDPVSEKLQRCELLRLARVVGRQDFEVLLDGRHDAGRCARAGLGGEPIRISWQVQRVLACSLPWVIRLRAGVTEGVEPVIAADQVLDLGACTARALCVELARATGGKPLQWRMVRLIGPALGQDEAAVDAAIAHAVEQGWLLPAGSPAHSICLTDAGRVWTARFVN